MNATPAPKPPFALALYVPGFRQRVWPAVRASAAAVKSWPGLIVALQAVPVVGHVCANAERDEMATNAPRSTRGQRIIELSQGFRLRRVEGRTSRVGLSWTGSVPELFSEEQPQGPLVPE